MTISDSLSAKVASVLWAILSYEYDDLHGWLKRIASSGGFEQKLYCEMEGNEPCFNGSISAMTWKVASTGRLRRSDYEYDGMNRQTSAEHGYFGLMETGNMESSVELENYGNYE